MGPVVDHPYQEEQGGRDDAVVEHLQYGAIHPQLRAGHGTTLPDANYRRHPQQHNAHVAHRRVGHHAL